MSPLNHKIRALRPANRPWVRDLLTQRWQSPRIVTRGQVHQADELPGFVAELAGEPAGLITYCLDADQCEIVSLDCLAEGQGLGSALVAAVRKAACDAQCVRLWLITTNDNLHALRFYQKRGFVLATIHRNALEVSRRLKPEIPFIGTDGIPLRDEIELEMLLPDAAPEQAPRRQQSDHARGGT